MKTIYIFPHFQLVVTDTEVITIYPDDTWTGGPVVPDDHVHAERMEISPFMHRITHELLHHVCATVRELPDSQEHGCRILWRSAHDIPQEQPEADLDEWYVTAMSYLVHDARMPTPEHYGALIDLERLTSVADIAAIVRWLLSGRGTILVPLLLDL